MTMFETERLLLRNFCTDDADTLYKIIARYAASEFAAYDQQWPTSYEEIQRITEWFASGDRYLAVCLKATGRLIGFVALNPEPEAAQPTFNLGYIFDFAEHGKGYATEACRAVLARAFEHLQAHTVVTGTAAANQASCRLLARLGFRKIAESTGAFRQTPDGQPIQFLGYTFELSREAWSGSAALRTRVG